MGYYADGSGSITFSRELKRDEENLIESILDSEWFEFDFFLPHGAKESGNPHNPIGMVFWCAEKYHSDRVEPMLRELAAIAPIKEGCLEYAGEDGAHWRFLYSPEDGTWREQTGHVVYEDI